MGEPVSSAVTDNFRYDCFISYRRSDGTTIAQWLRRHLVSYRLPKALASAHSTRLAVYLDTVYERATNDFFEQNIVPALEASRYLLVVATPDANRKRADGTSNWVDREIRKFLETPQRSNIIVVRAAGEFTDPLPGNLESSFPNVDIIDAREASNSFIRRILDRLITPNEIFTLIAPLFGIDQQKMPELRQEETKRTRRRIIVTAALTVAVVVSISLLSIYAWYQKIKTDEANQVVLARYLAWQSGVMAANSAKRRDEALLLAIEAYRRDPSSVTSSAIHSLMDQAALPVGRLKHDAKVNAVSFTPDGNYLASASEDGSLRIWDYTNGQVVSQLKLEKPARFLKFGPNADELTAVFRPILSGKARAQSNPDPGFIATWRWSQSTVTNRFEAPKAVSLLVFDAQQKGIAGVTTDGIWRPRPDSTSQYSKFASRIRYPMTLSQSSKYLAAVQETTVAILDVLSGNQVQSIALENDVRPTALAFSPDETQLLIGQSDGKSTLWRWKTKTKILEHQGFSDPTRLEFSPDGKYVAEIDFSLTAKFSVWLTKDAREIYSTSSDEELTGQLEFSTTISNDSRFLIVNLGDSSVRVVRVEDDYAGSWLQFTPQSSVHGVALHPNGKLLATADDDGWVILWRLEDGGTVAEFSETNRFQVGPRDGRLALLGKSLRVVDRDFKTVIEATIDTNNVRVVAFSPSGGMIGLAKDDGKLAVINLTNPSAASWRSIDDETQRASITPAGEEQEEDPSEIFELTFSKDEKKCIVFRRDGIREVDLESWRVTSRLNSRLPPNVIVSPDGSLVASKGGSIHIYSLESFAEVFAITTNAFDPAIGFSPDSKLFAGRSGEETMTVWDVASKTAILNTQVSSLTSEISFDSTSTYIAISDGDKVQLWNLRTKERVDLRRQKIEIGVLTFHPTELSLAVGYSDKKIRIWKLSPAPQIVSEIPQDEPFEFGSHPIRFTLDGKFLVRSHTGRAGEVVTVIPWQQDDLVRMACDRTIRKKLDPDVWNEHLKGQPYRETCQ